MQNNVNILNSSEHFKMAKKANIRLCVVYHDKKLKGVKKRPIFKLP